MHTVIVFPGGRQVDALLLAASAERLRVVIPGRRDTAEFQLIEGRWTSESGAHVELGAILAADSADAMRVLANAFGRALSAARLSLPRREPPFGTWPWDSPAPPFSARNV